MRRYFSYLSIVLLALACVGFVACDQEQVGSQVQQAGEIAQQAGQATGLAWLSLAGSLVSGLGALIAGKKAGIGADYARAPFTLEEAEEMAARMRDLGYKVTKG